MLSLTKHLVLGFCGRARTGKTTLANRVAAHLYLHGLKQAKDPIYIGFADAIKHDLMRVFNCSMEDIEKAKAYPMGRWVLEQVGTHYLTRPDILGYFTQRMSDLKAGPSLIIASDIRHIDESQIVRRDIGGFVTRVRRPESEDKVEIKPSEIEIEHITTDFIILNDHGLQHLEFLAQDLVNQILTHKYFKSYIS